MTNIPAIVADIRLVAEHVVRHPRGYAGFEVQRAQLVLNLVDLAALRSTLRSVRFVSQYYAPLTPTEQRVARAAERLALVLRAIEARSAEIQKQLVA